MDSAAVLPETVPPAEEPDVLQPTRATQLDPATRLSSRILLHLLLLPPYSPGETSPRSRSQGGMVEALDVPQGAVANVLRRLVAAGLLVEGREHVHGGTRRVKVYRLTGAGEELARDLWKRFRRPESRAPATVEPTGPCTPP